LLTLARRALTGECALAPGARLLAAVSGGPDSMALLHVLSTLRSSVGFELFAHGVDHGLRPGAAAELDLAAALASQLEVGFSRTRLALRPGGNLQARARDARYRALRSAASDLGGALIATAHHADDRAETVLLRLLRGAGPSGLAVLPARDGDRIRPFLRARRSDVLGHLGRHRISFATDPSNADPRFLRVRVRTELIPLLESLSPRIVDHLTALADELTRPFPRLEGPDGDPLVLGRAQQNLLDLLVLRRSRTGRVRLRGGWELSVDPRTGALRLGPGAGGRRGANPGQTLAKTRT
jgi:tRNA(Ile)-lysidine synthase